MPAYPLQIACFSETMRDKTAELNNVQQLAKMLTVENTSVSSGFTDVMTAAFLLFLTLPVTVATAERSFSKLKVIKKLFAQLNGPDASSGTFTAGN